MTLTYKDAVKNLYDATKKFGAGSAHTAMKGSFNDPQATAVLSIYIDERPDHEVLSDLIQWAEDSGRDEILKLIEHFSMPRQEEEEVL